MFRKSTKFGITIEATVTMIMTTTRSVYILILCLSSESVGSLKKDRSSMISNAQRIYSGYEVIALMDRTTLITIVNALIGRFCVI